MGQAVAQALHNKILQLIILPTEKCNFRCTYCYETFEIGKMKPPTVEGIKRLIQARLDRQSLEYLNLSWFGGEPLLAKEVVLDISQYAADLFRGGTLKGFSGDVTTNGYLLTPDVLTALVAAQQVGYQVSLDGFGEGHDQTRRYASGKGTFDVIWRNLLDARKTSLDFRMTLRCHMTAANAESMIQLIDAICTEFGGDSRFNVFFKPIENLGGPNSAKIGSLDRSSAKERVAVLQERLRAVNLGVTAVLEGPESNTGKTASGAGTQLAAAERAVASTLSPHAQQLAAYDGYICYAAKPNSLMIRADGSIGKCTVLMDDPRNKVGTLNPDGTLTLDGGLINNVWMRGFTSLKSGELGCPAQNLPKLPKEVPLKLVDLRPGVTA